MILDILDALDDTNVWHFLAAREAGAHINAPASILKRIFERSQAPKFSYSTELNGQRIQNKNLFVWDFDPMVLANAAARYDSCRVFGIIRDVWCASDAGTNVFDQKEPASDPAICYAVVCSPRSGSTFLCDLLLAAGVGVPREHIRDFFVHLCKSGYKLAELMEWIIERGTRRGYFGTKLVSNYLHELQRNGTSLGVVQQFLQERDFRIIFLMRDPAEQVISGYFAHSTGIWHLRGPAHSEGRHAAVPYDFDVLKELYSFQSAANRMMTQFVHQFATVLEVDYRELDADPQSTLVRVAGFLGAPASDALSAHGARTTQKISRSEPRMQEYLARFKRDLADAGLEQRSTN